MRISDWSSDVCSSDVDPDVAVRATDDVDGRRFVVDVADAFDVALGGVVFELVDPFRGDLRRRHLDRANALQQRLEVLAQFELGPGLAIRGGDRRSEEHTSELQSLMRISYAVFC